MKRHLFSRIAAAAALLSLPLFSCDDMESHNVPLLDTAKVLIDTNMTENAAQAPISMVKIRVTGPDFNIIEKEFPAAGVITLHLKPGINRFDITAFVTPGSPNLISTFRGSAVANISARSTSSVRVQMNVDETKLVVPDYGGGSYPGKLVMMDSINGGNRISRDAAAIGLAALYPYDVDFDSQNRIYFANNYAGASGGVFRMDDINSTVASGTCVQLVSDTSGVRSIAIDKKRNILYYVSRASENPIYKLNLNGGTPEFVTDSGYFSYFINSVCVDEATGYIYYNFFTSGSGYSIHQIMVFNPNTEIPGPVSDIDPYPSYNNYTTDLMVKAGYLYATYTYWHNTTPNPAAPPRIIRLPLDLDTATTPAEEISEKPDGTGQMIGPRVFIAVTSRKLYFIDETGTDDSTDRIISFDNITGAGWDTYSNADQFFRLYSTC